MAIGTKVVDKNTGWIGTICEMTKDVFGNWVSIVQFDDCKRTYRLERI